jgi:phosphotransferase system HPr (HPr) family protein
MVNKAIKVSAGLEARSVALFVQTASKFASRIQIQVETKKVNAKSIMGVISLGVLEGQEVAISAEGEDEEQAVSELIGFLKANRE